MANLESNRVSGITSVVNNSDVANLNYLKFKKQNIPSSTVNDAGDFLAVSSPDAAEWSLRTTGHTNQIETLSYGNNEYLLAGSSGNYEVSISTDAINWVLRTTPIGQKSITSSFISDDGVYLIGGETGILATSTNGIQWTLRTSSSASYININYSKYAPFKYTYASGSGIFGTSTDSIAWTLRTTGFTSSQSHTSVIYKDGFYIVSGDDGKISTSTNGIEWELRTSGKRNQIKKILSIDNGYLFSTFNGDISFSTNAIQWTSRTAGTTDPIYTLTVGGNQFIQNTYVYAGGSVGAILATSTDTITWIQQNTKKPNGLNAIYALVFGNETYVYGGGPTSCVATSKSSKFVWADASVTSSNSETSYRGVQEFDYTGSSQKFYIPQNYSNLFIEAVGGGGGGGDSGFIGQSETFSGGQGGTYSSWLLRKSEIGSATELTIDVGIGGNGAVHAPIEVTTDKVNFDVVGSPIVRSYGVTYLSTGYVAIENDFGARTIFSTDAIVWTLRTSVFNSTGLYQSNKFAITSGTTTPSYYLIGGADSNTTRVVSSTDSINWELRTTSITGFNQPGNSVDCLRFLNNIYFLGANRRLASSTNAIEWAVGVTTSNNSTDSINDITFGNGIYVYGSSSGAIVYSTDNIVWTFRTSGTTSQINAVGFGSTPVNTYLYASNSGILATSSDSIQWILRTSGTIQNINELFFNPTLNEYVALGSNNLFATSSDAITWTLRTSRLARKSNNVGVVYQNSQYVIVGSTSDSTVYSAPGAGTTVSWIVRSSIYSLTAPGGAAGSNPRSLNVSTVDQNTYYQSVGFAATTNPDPNITTLAFQCGAGGNGMYGNSSPVFLSRENTSYYVYGNLVRTNSGIISSTKANLNGSFAPRTYSDVPYGGGGGGGCFYAGEPEPVIWYVRTSPSITSASVLTYTTNDVFILAHNNSATTTGINTSSNAVVWIVRTVGITDRKIEDVTYGNNYYVAVSGSVFGTGGTISVSTNTISWTQRTTSRSLNAVAYGNALNSATQATYVVAGFNGEIRTSGSANLADTTNPTLGTWTLRTAAANTVAWYSVIYDGNYLIGGNNTNLWFSTDAIRWTRRTSPFGTIQKLKYVPTLTNPYLMASNSLGGFAVSTNGIEWTLRTTGDSAITVASLSYGNNVYIMTTRGGTMICSTDTITWRVRTVSSSSSYSVGVIEFGNDTFVNAYNNNQLLTTYTSTTPIYLVGHGGDGYRGGGGGGGSYLVIGNKMGVGGNGGDGYVRITWW